MQRIQPINLAMLPLSQHAHRKRGCKGKVRNLIKEGRKSRIVAQVWFEG